MEELKDCIQHLSKNNTIYKSVRINYALEKDVNYLKGEVLEKLSFAEKKVFEYVVQQKSTKEIASMLFLSEKTIEAHRAEIIKKLDIPPGKNALLKYASQFRNNA